MASSYVEKWPLILNRYSVVSLIVNRVPSVPRLMSLVVVRTNLFVQNVFELTECPGNRIYGKTVTVYFLDDDDDDVFFRTFLAPTPATLKKIGPDVRHVRKKLAPTSATLEKNWF